MKGTAKYSMSKPNFYKYNVPYKTVDWYLVLKKRIQATQSQARF